MSLIKTQKTSDGSYISSQIGLELDKSGRIVSKQMDKDYQPSQAVRDMRQFIVKCFCLGDVTMQKPRVEFNDMSVLGRMQVDRMKWNTYQPNNGAAPLGDEINNWQSNAIRPVTRNKAISIAAHATARLIFPKIFAYDDQNTDQHDAAQVMRDLMEWSGDRVNGGTGYAHTSLVGVMSALVDPAAIIHTEYGEVYRNVKDIREQQEDGSYKWKIKEMLDEELSGFQDTHVPPSELYIENIYEPDLQRQGWLIWRRVYSYSLAQAKYESEYPDNFKYVKPGVQLVYNDANQTFYQVYDTNMRQEDVEDIHFWHKGLDLHLCMVNGIMLTEPDSPNQRQDKLYPFLKFGYELIAPDSKFFYYKSLAFKMQPDDNVINTLYPMIIDGTYLQIIPPMVNTGGEAITSEVIIPGAVVTLSDPQANLRPIQTSTVEGMKVGMQTMQKVEESLEETTQDARESGQQSGPSTTAYEISKLEQNASTILGLFVKMISEFVKSYGKLRMGDILQYLTIADAGKITGDAELVYKTFILHDRQTEGKANSRKIKFDLNLPNEPMTQEEHLNESYKVLEEQGGPNSKSELYKVNPMLFRNLKFMLSVSPDVLNPRSEDLERAYNLEVFDKIATNPNILPLVDSPTLIRDLLFASTPTTKRDPDKFMAKQGGQNMTPGQQVMQAANGQQTPPLPQQTAGGPAKSPSPAKNMMAKVAQGGGGAAPPMPQG